MKIIFHKHRLSFLLLILIGLFLDVRIASACSCGPTPTVFDAYEEAGVVVIVRVVSVDKSENGAGYGGVSSTKVSVEKVFKGTLKVGDEMVFGQGGGSDCIWTFDEKSIDKQFLFYLSAKEKKPKIWFAVGCGRSSLMPYATDDLLYLNKLNKVRGKTRISGKIVFETDADLSVEGKSIRFIGADKTYEVKTDQNGVYEIYDLPAGTYLVDAGSPPGWKVDKFWLGYSPSVVQNEEDRSGKKIQIILEDKKHASLDIHFEVKIDGAIRGKIYDKIGKPMSGVCLKAIQAQSDKRSGYYVNCTEEDGKFAITEVPGGSYVIVINDDGKISSSEPFKTFYYPNVYELEKAAVLTIGEGETLDGINISVPRMEETIAIDGIFLYSDGKPVVDEGVEFKAEKTKDYIEGDARATTDSNGHFSIKILKGLKGSLYGEMYSYIGEFENCPQLESVIRETGRANPDIRTSTVEIQAENNLYDVELKYPFPGCKKAQ
jgi:hypothetical protein